MENLTWVLTTPGGDIEDGPIEMPLNQAMGHNQFRAANHMRSRWEEHKSEVHGSLDSIRAHISALDEELL